MTDPKNYSGGNYVPPQPNQLGRIESTPPPGPPHGLPTEEELEESEYQRDQALLDEAIAILRRWM